MAYEEELDQEDPQYQMVNGFRLPVPKGANADSEMTPAPNLSNVMAVRSPRAVNPDETRMQPGPEVAEPTIGPTRDSAVESMVRSTANRPPSAPPSMAQSQVAGMPSFADLMKERFEKGQRINPRDSEGKTLPKYHMGIGQRLLGVLGNFASGVAGKGPTTYIGPGATNRRYSQDEAQRQSRVGNIDEAIKQQEKVGDENRKLFEAANKGAYEAQVGAARGETADAQMQRARTAQDLSQSQSDLRASQEELNRAKAGKLGQGPRDKVTEDAESRQVVADKYGLKGKERQTFILTGKLPKELNDPMSEMRAELARMRLDDAQAARVDKVMKDAEAETTKHKGDIQKRIDKAEEQYGSLPGEAVNSANDQKRKQAMAQIERDDYAGMNRIGASLATRLRGYGVSATPPKAQPWAQSNLDEGERSQLLQAAPVGGAPAPGARPAATPARPAAAAQPVRLPGVGVPSPATTPRLNAGQSITWNGKAAKVEEVRRNSQTGEHSYKIDGQWYQDSELRK